MQGPYSVVRGMLKLDVLWHVCDSRVIFSVFELVISQPRSQDLSSPHPKGSEGRKTLVQAGHVSW